jgi:CxxC motif-containing protein (DUF1111 family)
MSRPYRPHALLVLSASLILTVYLQNLRAQGDEVVVGTEFGEPIQGITGLEFELFRLGLEDFLEVEDAEEGLGPIFNGRSCAECHAVPRVGGSGIMSEIRAGLLHEDGSFEELAGGSLIRLFSVPSHELQPMIPQEANVVARRKPLPLFGDGLVEAVADDIFIAMEDPDDLDGDGISGRAHRVSDKESGEIRIGRFGWKAQQSSLFTFGAEAYRDEMGITSALFPEEACPAGDCSLLELLDRVADPEDGPERTTGLSGIDNFANFMRLLGPPPRGEMTEEALQGQKIFNQIQCGACHVPDLHTGASPFRALRFKRFSPFGDFLLHDIATGDGIQQGDARPQEIRTAPLWGVRFRAPFLHDGRASNLNEAIEMHGAEAEESRGKYQGLAQEQKEALIAFLRSL